MSARFGDLLAEPLRNGVYKSKEHHGRGVKVVNMGELFGYPRLWDVPMKRLMLTDAELRKSSLQPGDLLFARRSLVAEGAGRCSVVKQVTEPTTFESSIIRARPDPAKADSDYLYYYFGSPQGRDLMRTILRQVAVSGIAGSDLAELQVPVPSIDTQRRCVGVLGTLDDRIDLLRRTNATLESIAQALFQSWFIDFDPVRAKTEGREPEGLDAATAALFPAEFEESALGLIPKGWEPSNLGAICTNPRAQAKPGQMPADTAYIGLEHMPRKSIALGNAGTAEGLESGKFWFDRNDVLFGKLRPYFHKVGLAPCRGVCSTDILVLRPKEPEWLGFMAMHASSEELVSYTTQLSNGARMPRTSWSDVAGFKIVLPSQNMAAAFDAMVRPMFERIHANIEATRLLAELRDTLLPRLISGKLRIPEAQAQLEDAIA